MFPSLLLALVVGLTGCRDDGPSGPSNTAVATVQVTRGGANPAEVALDALGDTTHLTARALDRDGKALSGRTFTWTSSDESIATVSAQADGVGRVLAVAPGVVTITAATGGKSGTGTVEIEQVVTAVTLEPSEVTLKAIGETASLLAIARDRNGHSVEVEEFEWESSDASKATVDEEGRVTAVGPGSISVTARAGEIDGSAQVNVVPEVTRIEVSPENNVVEQGETVQLTAHAFDDADNEIAGVTFEWSSSDTDVATVDEDGLVTGVRDGGPVTITATAADASGTAEVTVGPVPVATVAVTPRSFSLGVGETRQLDAAVVDASGNRIAGAAVSWSSNDETVATVSSAGLVTGVAVGGPVTITASSGGKSGTASLSVYLVQPIAQTTMSPGSDYTCALSTAGDAYCWGKNSEGQLGTGTIDEARTPTQIAGSQRFAAIASGSSHACGLTADGRVYCWGQNDYSQLADGSTTDRLTPVAASGGLSFEHISSGSAHSCALTDEGKAYCWGDNSEGQLGDGTLTRRAVPTPVAGDQVFRQISAGYGYTCATTTSYAAYCWGYNAGGQLGDGTTTNRDVPTRVGAGLDIAFIQAGANFTCALTAGGEAHCWGKNTDGQLGDGSTTPSITPVAVIGGLTFRSIRLGVDHSCALTNDGKTYCWGRNHGLLGNGSTANSSRPVAVSGGHTFRTIGVGRQHSCGVTPAGEAYCWGANSNGQLGDGTTTARSVPVAVSGSEDFK